MFVQNTPTSIVAQEEPSDAPEPLSVVEAPLPTDSTVTNDEIMEPLPKPADVDQIPLLTEPASIPSPAKDEPMDLDSSPEDIEKPTEAVEVESDLHLPEPGMLSGLGHRGVNSCLPGRPLSRTAGSSNYS